MTKLERVERSALTFAIFLSFFSGAGGILAYFLTGSGALLLDGVFSTVNFAAAIFAMVVSTRSGKKASLKSPFGNASMENVFLLFRSLLLVSYLAFTLVSSTSSVIAGSSEQIKPVINLFGYDVNTNTFMMVYSTIMIAISGLIIINNKKLNKTVQNKSAILKLETKSAIVDGVVSLAAAIAVIISTTVEIDFLKRNSDNIMVIILVLVLIMQPAKQFANEIRRLSGVRVDFEIENKVKFHAKNVLKVDLAEEGFVGDFELNDVFAVQRGKHTDVFISVSFTGAKTMEELDAISDEIKKELHEDMPNCDVDVLWTCHKIHKLDFGKDKKKPKRIIRKNKKPL